MGVIRLTDTNFNEEVVNAELPVLVDFWGSWCPPCKMVEPIIDNLAQELEGKTKIGKLNVDQNPKTSSEYQVKGAPTFILFKDGEEVKRIVGARSKKQLMEVIDKGLRGNK